MANEVLFPFLLPLSFTKKEPAEIPQYVSRFYDQYRFKDTIRDFEQRVCYHQKWMMDDSIRLQLISNYGPVTITLKDRRGFTVGTPFTFTTMQEDQFRPGYFIRQLEIDLADFEPGMYYWQLQIGGSDVWVTEPQEFLDNLPNSLYYEYSHYERRGDVIFQTGIVMSLRVESIIKHKAAGSRDTVYEDQELNQVMIKSTPYRLYDLIIGNAKGIPPWLANKLAWVLGCSELRLDGRYYTKNEGAELEIVQTDLYPMSGYVIEMRDRYNRTGVEYEDDVQIVGKNSMMAVIDTKGFGMDDSGGDFLEYVNVE